MQFNSLKTQVESTLAHKGSTWELGFLIGRGASFTLSYITYKNVKTAVTNYGLNPVIPTY